jgi:hypothetical protein
VSIVWIQLLGACALVGFGIVRLTRLRAVLAAGLGLLAGAGYWGYIALIAEPGALGRELEAWIGAVVVAMMLVAWLIGVAAAAFLRRRASTQS